MGDKTGISWTDSTWGPVRGCSRISPGCQNCYAERIAGRFSGPGRPFEDFVTLRRRHPPSPDGRGSDGVRHPQTGQKVTGIRAQWNGIVRMVPEHLVDPLRWHKPRRIFVSSMSDIFHEKLSNEEIAAIFGVMAACPRHTFQVLTKRAARAREWFAWLATEAGSCNAGVGMTPAARCFVEAQRREAFCNTKLLTKHHAVGAAMSAHWPLPNVWLGTSVENQDAANERIPELIRTPAVVHFLSCEPLLGPVELERAMSGCFNPAWLNWVIAGCESGPGARRCETSWLRSLRDQCARAHVAFFLKQAKYDATEDKWGQPAVHHFGDRGSKMKAGKVVELPCLDGEQHYAFPEVAR